MSLEVWLYHASNLVVLLLGGAIVALSALAYRRTRDRTYAQAGLGFAFITLGSLADAGSDLILFEGVVLTTNELLLLRTLAGALTGLGLGVLFYSISRS